MNPLDPAAVRRLGDQRRRRQHTMYGVIAAVVVAVAVIPTAVIATKGDGKASPPPFTNTSSADPSPTPTPTPTSKIIVFPGGGVAIKAPADTDKLVGTSDEFQAFIKTAWQQDYDQGCKAAEVDVMKYSTDGFGAGGVGGCGGYQAIWALRAGVWKEVLATQDEWICSDLVRYDVPDEVAGPCYTPKPPPAIVSFGENGVHIISAADVDKLEGTTDDFKQFILDTALPKAKAGLAECHRADPQNFDPDTGGVRVFKFAQAGYAAGEVDDCSGYSVLWKDVDGTWRQIMASQEAWICGDLTRYEIPLSFDGAGCYGPTELFGPDEDGGIKLGMSAEQVKAAGGTISEPGNGCGFVYPDLTWDPTSMESEPPHNSANALGYLSPTSGRGVVALVAADTQVTPEGIREGSSKEEVEKAYPGGHLDQGTGAWISPIDSTSYYRFDFKHFQGLNYPSTTRISMVSKDQDCFESVGP
ncbi:MAG: hypothetical protein ACJ72L_06860 [Marmoricola sp.]